MAPVLGIDLGTTNSVVCVGDGAQARVLPDADGNLLIPSVVSFHPKGDVLVGHGARERRLLDARNTIYSVKRLIGRPYRSAEVQRAQDRFPFELCEGPTQGVLVRARGETYTLPEISAFVLREVRRIAEARMAEPCTQAVITVPANFNELQRSATKAAGRVAGLDVLRILNEPTAAALAYGYGKGSRERIAVFDLGGGTFDITILELAGDVFEVLSTAGDTFLGGDDIDLLIAEKMADAFLQHHHFDPRTDPQAFERLRAAAEWAKCQLSNEEEVQLRVEELAYGEGGTSLDLSFGMTRKSLEQLAVPLIGRAFDVCNDAMRVANIAATQLDNVILVGGSTRIPLVRRMVAEFFQRQPLDTIDPDLVVARGAALQAAALAPQTTEGSGARRLAKVALKKISRSDLKAIRTKREQEIAKENEQKRPAQPAFAPARPVETPTWDDVDDLPTRVARGLSEVQDTTDITPITGEVTRAAAEGYVEQVSKSKPPAPPPPGPGARTLGFGSNPLPAFEEPKTTPRGRSQPPPSSPPATAPKQPAAPSVVVESPYQAPDQPTDPFANPSQPLPQPPPFETADAFEDPPPSMPMPPQAPPQPPPQPLAHAAAPPQPPQPPPQPPQAPPPQPPFQPQAQHGALPSPSFHEPVIQQKPPAPPVKPPLLLDVTPLTLGIETVGGYCEGVIARNAAIPVEQSRIFTTGADDQEAVSVRIYQGESRMLAENQPLGMLVLAGLRQAARGAVKIEVTFLMDADGTLSARARDLETGREQSVSINLVGEIKDDEIAAMRERQARMMGRA